MRLASSHRSRRAAVTVAAGLVLLTPAGVAQAGGTPAGNFPLTAAALDAATIPRAGAGDGRPPADRGPAHPRPTWSASEAWTPTWAPCWPSTRTPSQEAAASDRRGAAGARSPLEGIPVLLKDNIDTDRDADDRRLAGAAGQQPGRRDAHPAAARRRRRRARQGEPLGVGELPQRPTPPAAGAASAARRTTPTCSTATRAARRPARPPAVAAVAGAGGHRHRDRRLDRLPGRRRTATSASSRRWGMVSRTGIVPISAEQDTAGPIARHAIDAALTLQAIDGADRGRRRDAAPAGRHRHADFARPGPGRAAGRADRRLGCSTPTATASTARRPRPSSHAAVEQLKRPGATAVTGAADVDQEEIGAGRDPGPARRVPPRDQPLPGRHPGKHPADLAGLIAFDEQRPGRGGALRPGDLRAVAGGDRCRPRPGGPGDPGQHPAAGPRLDRRGASPRAPAPRTTWTRSSR